MESKWLRPAECLASSSCLASFRSLWQRNMEENASGVFFVASADGASLRFADALLHQRRALLHLARGQTKGAFQGLPEGIQRSEC